MAKKPIPEPLDAATVMRLKAELESDMASDDMQIRSTRLVREMKDPINTGSKRYTDIVVRDPRMTDEIGRNVATLSLNPPQVTCIYPPGGAEPAEHNTTMREVFYSELLEDMATRIEGQNARTRGIDMCVGDGGVWTKVLFAKDLWEEAGALRRRRPGEDPAAYDLSTEQAKKDAGQPFVMIAVDPLSGYPVRSGVKLEGFVEVQKRPLTQTLLRYNLTIDGREQIVPRIVGQPQNQWDATKFPTTVEFVEYWDAWRCYQILSGAGQGGPTFALEPWLHGYGRPPYFSGMGFMMGHWANRKVGWGIGETKRWLVSYSSFQQTLMADVSSRDAYRPVIHTLGESSAAMAPLLVKDGKPEWTDEMQLESREVVLSYPGDAWESFPMPDVSPALKESIALTDKMIEATLSPKVTSDIGGGMEGAGFSIAQVMQAAKVPFHPYVQNLEQMNVDILNFIDWLIVNKVKQKVWLFAAAQDEADGKPAKPGGWIGLSPDDITRFPVKKTVQIDPEGPTAKLIEGRYWQEQVLDGFADEDTAIRAQGRNPDAVREGRTRDDIRKSDWYKAKVQKNVAQEMGLGHEFALSKLARIVAQTGGLPGLTPQAPAAPPGPQGGPMQDQGALAASPGGQPPDMGQVQTAGPGLSNTGGTNVVVPQAAAGAGMQQAQ